MGSVVRTEALSKDFQTGFWRPRPHRALFDLSIDIQAGDVFGLLGPNGAGKSTTLKLLNNLLWPSSGRAEILGRPPGDRLARRRLGFLPENPTFYDQLTAEELLVYFGGLFGLSPADRRTRAAKLLDDVGIGADRRRPLRQYSKGMVQRVGLAQALVNDPELVILDEPMSGLDPVGRREVRDLILRLRDQGRTILFSSHILSDAELLCNRVGIINKGRLVAAGAVSELTAQGARAGHAAWDVTLADVTPSFESTLRGRLRRLTRIADGRVNLELPPDVKPESFIAESAANGATLVSVAPVRTTLEDVFLKALEAPGPVERARGASGVPLAKSDVPAKTTSAGVVDSRPSAIAQDGSSLGRVAMVAVHVFKESVRDRVLYAIGGFALLLVAASMVIGQITAGQDVKIIKDLGLATIELAGVLMTVFIGVGLVSREIDRRSIFSLLAKPLARSEFIVGKYTGLVLTLFVNIALMTAALFVMLAWMQWTTPESIRASWDAPAVDPRLLLSVILIGAELALLTAIALFFSTFSSSALLSIGFTIGLLVVGLESQDLRNFDQIVSASPVVTKFVSMIGWLVPAFSAFDVKAQVVHGLAVPGGLVLWRVLYAAVYAAVAAGASVIVFSRREFK